MNASPASQTFPVRPLRRDDLERLVSIDKAHTGNARRRFMEKRLAAAVERPDEHLQVGVEHDGQLVGFALGRMLYGEFGQLEPVAVLDAMGVDPSSQEHGFGHALIQGVETLARRQGVHWLHTQADWTSHGLLRFFDSAGFKLGQRVVLERDTSRPIVEPESET